MVTRNLVLRYTKTMEQLPQYDAASQSAVWKPWASDVLRCTGSERHDFLHRMSTNDVLPLHTNNSDGMGIQTVIISEKARIIDVITLLEFQSETIILCSAGKAPPLLQWFDTFLFSEDVTFSNLTNARHFFLVAGPQAVEALAHMTGLNSVVLYGMPLFYHQTCTINAIPLILIRQKSFSELSFMLIVDAEFQAALAESLGNTLPELDEPTFELLRIEAGMPQSGAEWTELYNPLEAGLITAVSFTKGCYIGQEVVARLDAYNKVKFRLTGLSSANELHTGATLHADAQEVGIITSAAYSPARKSYLALAYLRGAFMNPGTSVEVRNAGSATPAMIHLLPFERM